MQVLIKRTEFPVGCHFEIVNLLNLANFTPPLSVCISEKMDCVCMEIECRM